MNEVITKLRSLLEEVTLQCDAEWIGFSGGLDSSILAQIKKDQDLNAITVIAKDFLGTDLSYSQIVANHIEIPLELKRSAPISIYPAWEILENASILLTLFWTRAEILPIVMDNAASIQNRFCQSG